jgi:hypothetical protein
MKTEPRKEHEWLEKFVGEWTMEADSAAPDQSQGEWTETGRSIGGGWVVIEGSGPMPDGGPATTIMTLGYDSHRERFVGTWLGSMMDHLWVYEGTLDGNVLTLNTEGPSMEKDAPRKLVKYKDMMELKSDDHRVLTSHKLGDDGEWSVFMTASYRRKGGSSQS